MKSWNKLVLLAVVFCLSTAGTAQASGDAGRKLGRGLSNVAFGWVDILRGVENSAQDDNIVSAVTVGPVTGLGNAVGRTLAGVYETVTFPIPTNDGTYDPITSPEFVLEKGA